MKNLDQDKVFIHVGPPKAASTTLQKLLFEKHSGLNFIGGRPGERARPFYNNILSLNDVEYKAADNRNYKDLIFPNIKKGKKTVISSENFCLSLSKASQESKAKRLREMFPRGKIILIARNQFDIMRSWYEYIVFVNLCSKKDEPPYPEVVENGKIIDFNSWIEKSLANYNDSFLPSLDYYEIATLYSQLFGQENVGVFMFEELVNDIEAFAGKLSRFMEIDFTETMSLLAAKKENPARSDIFMKLLKIRKSLLPNLKFSKFLPVSARKKIITWLNQGERTRYKMSLENEQKVRDLYRRSNQKLEKTFNLDLEKYKYPI